MSRYCHEILSNKIKGKTILHIVTKITITFSCTLSVLSKSHLTIERYLKMSVKQIRVMSILVLGNYFH